MSDSPASQLDALFGPDPGETDLLLGYPDLTPDESVAGFLGALEPGTNKALFDISMRGIHYLDECVVLTSTPH